MDNYENNFSDQPSGVPESDTPITHIPEPEKKQSPFANSPYIMDRVPEATPNSSPKATKQRSGKGWKTAVSFILITALVAGSCGITAYSINQYWQQRMDQTNRAMDLMQNQIEDLQEQIKDNSFTGNGNSISGSTNTSATGMVPGQIYAKCVNSVVAIQVSSAQSSGSGSGFILSADGYIVTNYHVISGGTSISVTIHDGTEYPAEIVGHDDTNDLALLKIEATELPYVTLGSSDDLIVGDQVVAIGNPLGTLTSTLTVGYISAKERDISTDGTVINMLQTDAAINAGNSGGPLFNMKGEVVGIITAKYSGSTSSGASIEGIGFAIPIDDVTDKIQQLKDRGYVSTPYMGITIDNRNEGIGAYVVSVEANSSAQIAGIRAGDIIVGLAEHEITSIADISKALRNFKVGDTTTITVYRNRKLLDLSITFMEKPQSTLQSPSVTPENSSQENTYPDGGSYWDWWDRIFGNGN